MVGTTKQMRRIWGSFYKKVALMKPMGTPGARDVEEFEGAEELLTPTEHAACRRSASSPTQGSKAKFKRVLRKVHRDYCGCRSTRKSTTGLLARRIGHIIHERSGTESRTQWRE
eukprot:238805-Amphidinium_carterae.1